jgi:hypothetical protein
VPDTTSPAFPLSPTNDDPRFTLGLALDVAEAIQGFGYPPITSGADLVRLQSALFSFLYGSPGTRQS